MNNRVSSLVFIFLIASLPGSVLGQVDSADDLVFPSLPEFKLPDPTRVELDNGLVVLLLEDHELPLVRAVARIRTGARYEPPDKIGLASLTGTVIRTGGTTEMPSDTLDDFLENRAANVSSSIGGSYGSASMSCLKDDFPEVFSIFGDMLRRPAFDGKRLAVAVNQTMAGISRQNDDPMRIMSREFDEIVYGAGSPYGRVATFETIQSITRADLVAWHARFYHPNNVILGLLGDFDEQEVLQLVEKTFGDWPRGPDEKLSKVGYEEEARPGVYYVEKNDMTQSNIKIGHLGITRDNPDLFAVEVLNQVFSGTQSSRLFSNVRSKKGLAYAVIGGVRSNWDYPGTFNMWMTTKTETTGEGIDALLEEARNLSVEPPTEEEVSKAKTSILASFIFNVDTRAKILGQQLTYEYYGFPLNWVNLYRKGIEEVTLDQVREVAEKYIHLERFVILVVGPSEGRDRPLTNFGEVTEVDITIPKP
jgi:zinc protease